MKRLVGALVAATVLACAAAAAAIETQSGDDITISGAHDDMVFAAGGHVDLRPTATDSVFAAGGEITTRDAQFEQLLVGAGDLAFANATARDVIALGGDLDFASGEIRDDLVAAGGKIRLAQEARIGGSAVLAGGQLAIETPIGADLRAAGGVIRLNAPVTGSVALDGDYIMIGPQARIGGELRHRARRIEISPQAQITGRVIALEPRAHRDRGEIIAAFAAIALAICLGLIVLGVVVAIALPKLMNDSAAMLRTRPLSALGLGFLFAALAPVMIVFLTVTVIGLPLAFLLAVACALFWPLAIVASAYTLGMAARGRMRRDAPATSAGGRALWTALALFLLVLVGALPILGQLAWTLAYLFGLGAITVQASRALAAPAPVSGEAPA